MNEVSQSCVTTILASPQFYCEYKCAKLQIRTISGEIEILPGHADLISIIGDNVVQLTVCDSKNQKLNFAVFAGILAMRNGICYISCGDLTEH